jgi:ERCC4-type nuclease
MAATASSTTETTTPTPCLTIDVREHSLTAALTAFGIPFSLAALAVGDFQILAADGSRPLLIGERKTLADFAASNMDGRYREQRARLLAARGSTGCALVYVLEGNWTGDDSRIVGGHGRVTEGLLRRLTTRLQIRYGMPVLAAASVAETARWIGTLLAQIRDDTAVFQPEEGEVAGAVMAGLTGAISTVKKENRTGGSVATAMLSAIPGLGEKRCGALLALKSIRELAVMSAEEIGALSVGGRKLGAKVGAAIAEALGARA